MRAFLNIIHYFVPLIGAMLVIENEIQILIFHFYEIYGLEFSYG